ncbi:hypothetical protein BGW38_006745 [Lunasporangiospora selenospora]|uniref:BTB domain-containing protein n=1 Tax=Lunasporangiospora selenospora TaxID=979761 RepID=A0A9P6G0Y5_9FUNG|nr:hypothetical protein BGW38_006745 [Lunasporangiospora selenospora]
MAPRSDICSLHFRVPDGSQPESKQPDSSLEPCSYSNDNNNTTCRLTVLAKDKTQIRASLGPLSQTKFVWSEFQACCSFQVFSGPTQQLLVAKTVQSGDIWKRGTEFVLERKDIWVDQHYEFVVIFSSFPLKLLGPIQGKHQTHPLKVSSHDPVRMVDPFVEMMVRFQHHAGSADVEFLFPHETTSSAQSSRQDREQILAHRAILSIYPALSRMLAQDQGLAFQRSRSHRTTIRVDPRAIITIRSMLDFMYSGMLPQNDIPFVQQGLDHAIIHHHPDHDRWKITFEIAHEYGLDTFVCASPWIDWHVGRLRDLIRDENVLHLYFGWGHAYVRVAELCIQHVAERMKNSCLRQDSAEAMIRDLQERYRVQHEQTWPEFHAALLKQMATMYCEQQQQQKCQQFQIQQQYLEHRWQHRQFLQQQQQQQQQQRQSVQPTHHHQQQQQQRHRRQQGLRGLKRKRGPSESDS